VTTQVPALLDYITDISPEFRKPTHLADLSEIFDLARKGIPVRLLCTFPIRFFKTETVLHGLLWLLEHDPTLRIVLMTYSHERAKWLGKRLRVLARRTKVGPTRGHDTIEEWANDQGGGVVVMSAEQSREGYDCHVLLVDDPLDEHSAKTQESRDAVDNAILHYSARCQRHGKPGSVLVIMSRFDEDDPIGRRLGRRAEIWLHMHMPAVVNENTPERRSLAEDVWPLEDLDRLREVYRETDPKERIWFARLMGVPPANVTSSFGPPRRYHTLPAWPGYVDFMGVDMSYSRSSRADYAAICIVRWMYGVCYVRHVRRAIGETKDLAQLIVDTQLTYGKLPMFSFVSGPERGAISYFNQIGLPIQYVNTTEPKFIRAQPTIDAHNAGTILWPDDPWVEPVYQRMRRFAGNESDHDDEVDALVSVFTLTRSSQSNVVPIAVGRRRM
jgi:predicted phage terminase large subunit-like protein